MLVHTDKNNKEESGIKVTGVAKHKVYKVLLKYSKKNVLKNLSFLKSVTNEFKNKSNIAN